MTIDDVLKLVNAGFTANQISEMINASPVAPEQVDNVPIDASPDVDKIDKIDSQPSAAPEPFNDFSGFMAAIDQKFNDLATSLRGSLNPTISDVKPLGIEDIISKFFKED